MVATKKASAPRSCWCSHSRGSNGIRSQIPPLPAAVDRRRDASLFRREGSHGQKLAYVYFEDEPGRQAAANQLTRDEARRIAAHIAKLPKLLLKNKKFIIGVDDAGKPNTTFSALKIVAFKTTSVDFKFAAST